MSVTLAQNKTSTHAPPAAGPSSTPSAKTDSTPSAKTDSTPSAKTDSTPSAKTDSHDLSSDLPPKAHAHSYMRASALHQLGSDLHQVDAAGHGHTLSHHLDVSKLVDHIASHDLHGGTPSSDSHASSSSGQTAQPNIAYYMQQMSQNLGKVKAHFEPASTANNMRDLVSAAGSGNAKEFNTAESALVSGMTGANKASKHAQNDSSAKASATVLSDLSHVQIAFNDGQRLGGGKAAPNPTKNPTAWTNWANGQKLPSATVSVASESSSTYRSMQNHMINVSQALAHISASSEVGSTAGDMQKFVQAAAGNNVSDFKQAYSKIVRDMNHVQSVGRGRGRTQDVQNAQNALDNLSSIYNQYSNGQRLPAVHDKSGGNSINPAKDPKQWTTWANNQSVQNSAYKLVSGLTSANPLKDTYNAPGQGGITAVHVGGGGPMDAKLANSKDVKNFLIGQSTSNNYTMGNSTEAPSFDQTQNDAPAIDKNPIAYMKQRGYQVFNVPGANTTVITNPKSGTTQFFNTSNMTAQNMPPWSTVGGPNNVVDPHENNANGSGTYIFGDGTRLDVKAGEGLTFVSGKQILTTIPQFGKNGKPAKPNPYKGNGEKYNVYSYTNPFAVQAYVAMNSVNTNNLAVYVKHAPTHGPSDGKYGWAYANGVSKDGSQAWTAVATGENWGGVGDPGLAWLNKPNSGTPAEQNTLDALYSKNTGSSATFAPNDVGAGWTSSQLGAGGQTEGRVLKQSFEQFGIAVAGALASFIPGLDGLGAIAGGVKGAIQVAGDALKGAGDAADGADGVGSGAAAIKPGDVGSSGKPDAGKPGGGKPGAGKPDAPGSVVPSRVMPKSTILNLINSIAKEAGSAPSHAVQELQSYLKTSFETTNISTDFAKKVMEYAGAVLENQGLKESAQLAEQYAQGLTKDVLSESQGASKTIKTLLDTPDLSASQRGALQQAEQALQSGQLTTDETAAWMRYAADILQNPVAKQASQDLSEQVPMAERQSYIQFLLDQTRAGSAENNALKQAYDLLGQAQEVKAAGGSLAKQQALINQAKGAVNSLNKYPDEANSLTNAASRLSPTHPELNASENQRAFETFLSNGLVRNTSQETMSGWTSFSKQVDSLFNTMPDNTQEAVASSAVRYMSVHGARNWEQAVPEMAQIRNAQTPMEQLAAIRSFLNTPITSGYSMVARASVLRDLSLAMNELHNVAPFASPKLEQVWLRQNWFYDHAIGPLTGRNGYIPKASGLKPDSSVGGTAIHQPSINGEGVGSSVRPALEGNIDIQNAGVKAMLDNGQITGLGTSGSTNILVHLFDWARSEGLALSPKSFVQGVSAFLVNDGGHSLGEVLWTLNNAMRGNYNLGGDAFFQGSYAQLHNIFANDPEVNAAFAEAWQQLVGYMGNTGK